jgi:hypothetical protein
MSSLRRILAYVLIAPLLSCASHAAPATAIAPLPAGPCPAIPDSAPGAPVDSTPTPADSSRRILLRDGPFEPRYLSVVIDGRWAIWNDESLGPDLDPKDVDSLTIVRAPTARATYGTCPGVDLVIVTTKSKTWRPYAPNHD